MAVLKNGNTFGDGRRLTSTDALQLQNKYCSAEKYKASANFITSGFPLPVSLDPVSLLPVDAW